MRATTTRIALLASALAVVGAPAVADARVIWRTDGGGWGHGVGLSQYGAYGFAKRGTPYHTILRHYYTGTTIGSIPSQTVRVLLGGAGRVVRFSGANSACGVAIYPGKTYFAKRRGGGVVLRKGKQKLANCGKVLSTGGGQVTISGYGTYRGSLEARAAGGGLNVINAAELEEYIRGVVPRESPSAWPLEALKAQAVAARSYAIASPVDGAGFDQYQDTRSQVYGGLAAETGRTNQAVDATAYEVVLYKGKVAQTFFFSTSGGHTEHNEYSFLGGAPVPYLRGVPDPYDFESPYHTWKAKYSPRSLGSKLGVGALRQIVVLSRGISGRIVKLKATGKGGARVISGTSLRSALGLRDTLVYFTKVKTGARAGGARTYETDPPLDPRVVFGPVLPGG